MIAKCKMMAVKSGSAWLNSLTNFFSGNLAIKGRPGELDAACWY